MKITVLGLNHRTAPVRLRERLHFSQHHLGRALTELRQALSLPECAILSTCNRVEIYALLPQLNGSRNRLTAFLSRFHRLESRSLDGHLYWYLQPDSVRHLFRVSAGLDSMVIGESEILGQVKSAYARAVEAGSVGPVFHRFFQTALRVGKQVRTATRINQGAVSVGSVAVELSRRIFRRLEDETVFIWGAGQMAEPMLALLRERGAGRIWVSNRTSERAERLAASVGGEVIRWERRDEALCAADIVICSTSADHFLLTADQLRRVMAARRQKPLFLVDISVPRNIDPQAGRLENVYLYDIDDLGGIVESNRKMRFRETERCAAIVEVETGTFLERLKPCADLRPCSEGNRGE